MTEKSNPVVFISYAHEGDLSEQVKKLAAWLTERGVEVITDHPYVNRAPEIGWRLWMQHNIEDADMVLIVCSERYKNLFERRQQDIEGGFGVTWESAIITDAIYQSRCNNTRFYPILPDAGEHQHVPVVLRDWNNDHRFPSGQQRIFSLICDKVVIHKPKRAFQIRLKGELHGSSDSRLIPREDSPVQPKQEELVEKVPKPKKYAIGDKGLAGGIIFYVDSSGLHGLEAQADNSYYKSFFSIKIFTFKWNEAITTCTNYGAGWHLPTKDELNLLYQQRKIVEPTLHPDPLTGDFLTGGLWYTLWSSTENDNYRAWTQNFSTSYCDIPPGFQAIEMKSVSHRVRAVRAF